MFALATAIAADLGYVEPIDAAEIVSGIAVKLVMLSKQGGLLPHFLTNETITPNTEWSSVDTTLAVLATTLACQATAGCDTAPLVTLVQNIDWSGLTASGTLPVSHGYDFGGGLLGSRWDAWGSEPFLVTSAYAAAQGSSLPLNYMDTSTPKTWDGSGFNDELANLFFPMTGDDAWDVDWSTFRSSAHEKQLSYKISDLFGLSACEVPEPWSAPNEQAIYQVLGTGGFGVPPETGVSITQYPFVCLHYAAMISADKPRVFEHMMKYLIETAGIFTPLNNVESVGFDQGGRLAWNELKGSWNLSMQALGAARGVYACKDGNYLPHAMTTNTDPASVCPL
jgi:hypothetical protein